LGASQAALSGDHIRREDLCRNETGLLLFLWIDNDSENAVEIETATQSAVSWGDRMTIQLSTSRDSWAAKRVRFFLFFCTTI